MLADISILLFIVAWLLFVISVELAIFTIPLSTLCWYSVLGLFGFVDGDGRRFVPVQVPRTLTKIKYIVSPIIFWFAKVPAANLSVASPVEIAPLPVL